MAGTVDFGCKSACRRQKECGCRGDKVAIHGVSPITDLKLKNAGRNRRLPVLGVPKPRGDEILVRIEAASVNPVDYKIREGKFAKASDDALPITLGVIFPVSSRNLAQMPRMWRWDNRYLRCWAMIAAPMRNI
jgi:hypothetical protein